MITKWWFSRRRRALLWGRSEWPVGSWFQSRYSIQFKYHQLLSNITIFCFISSIIHHCPILFDIIQFYLTLSHVIQDYYYYIKLSNTIQHHPISSMILSNIIMDKHEMAICCPQGTQVRPKWNESDTQVTTKWHPSETKVTPKWRSSEVQVTLKRHQSDTQIYTGANTGPMGGDTDPRGQWLLSGMIIAILWTFIPLVVQKIIAKVCKTLLFTKNPI